MKTALRNLSGKETTIYDGLGRPWITSEGVAGHLRISLRHYDECGVEDKKYSPYGASSLNIQSPLAVQRGWWNEESDGEGAYAFEESGYDNCLAPRTTWTRMPGAGMSTSGFDARHLPTSTVPSLFDRTMLSRTFSYDSAGHLTSAKLDWSAQLEVDPEPGLPPLLASPVHRTWNLGSYTYSGGDLVAECQHVVDTTFLLPGLRPVFGNIAIVDNPVSSAHADKTYTYDSLGRVTEARTEWPDGAESRIVRTYDAIGRLKRTTVSDGNGSVSTDVCYTVQGWPAAFETTLDGQDVLSERLRYWNPVKAADGARHDGNSAPMLYDYDADGNLASDGHTGFEFSYNILNLPMSAEDSADGRTMTYTYLGDGTKLKAVSDGGAGLTYRGSFVYGLTSGGGCTLESVATDEGRIVMDGTAVKDEWHVRDHVGNVRSVVWLNAPAGTSVSASILEQNDYLPFGTRLPGSRTDQSNRYRYAGKEEQDIAGMDLCLMDFGARYYDAFVGRWNAVDPLAHKYFGMSPYNYCGNDPVNKVDPDGRETIKSLWIKLPNSYDPKYKKPASDKCDTQKDSGTDRYNNDRAFVISNISMMNTNMPDYDNILTFVAHGVVDENKKSVDKITVSKDGGPGEQMKVDAVAEYLNGNSSVVKNAKEKGTFAVIFLMSCATAQNGKDSIASQLSINMESVVIAPTETCLSNGDVRNDGKWNVYYKGYLLDTVPGDGNSIYEYLSNLDSNMH